MGYAAASVISRPEYARPGTATVSAAAASAQPVVATERAQANTTTAASDIVTAWIACTAVTPAAGPSTASGAPIRAG